MKAPCLTPLPLPLSLLLLRPPGGRPCCRTSYLPACSTSSPLHSPLFLHCLLPASPPSPSPVQWPLSKCVFVSPSEAQCVSATWPQATHDQWSTAKTIRQETLLSSHHLWLRRFSFRSPPLIRLRSILNCETGFFPILSTKTIQQLSKLKKHKFTD